MRLFGAPLNPKNLERQLILCAVPFEFARYRIAVTILDCTETPRDLDLVTLGELAEGRWHGGRWHGGLEPVIAISCSNSCRFAIS